MDAPVALSRSPAGLPAGQVGHTPPVTPPPSCAILPVCVGNSPTAWAGGPSRPSLPRWSLVLVAGIHAAVLGWAALVLPWRGWTAFSVVIGALALLHLGTAVAAAARPSVLVPVWRVAAWASLACLAWLAWQVVSSAVYIARIYGSLGEGVAAGLGAVLGVLSLFTLPIGCWGAACTWPPLPARVTRAAGLLLLLATGLGLWRTSAQAAVRPLPLPGEEGDLGPALERALPDWDALPPVPAGVETSLFSRAPAVCDPRLLSSRETTTAVVTWLATAPPGVEVRTRCLQASPDRLLAALSELLVAEALQGPVKIDLLAGVQRLVPRWAPVDSLSLRPGLDGACLAGACLMPWQLVALDHLTAHRPLDFVHDLTLGVSLPRLRAALGGGGERTEDLQRVETVSFVVGADGRLVRLRRGRPAGTAPDQVHLRRAAHAAERFIAAAQLRGGRFRYTLDPHTGEGDRRRYSLPRQAGTTLVVCELGEARRRTRRVAGRSLAMMSRHERRHGELSALVKGRRRIRARLGSTALPAIAFLTCRDRVGPGHDELIARLGRFLLVMQRPDGGFHPEYDLAAGAVVPGPDPLYAGGQAVFALSLLEALALREPGLDLPPAEVLTGAVERAMTYTATRYWAHAASDFLFLEENWHCLAARASLGHHRHPAYERFCLDYVAFKSRLVLDEDSGVDGDLHGAYGFGNVGPPHNTATAGYTEALAAAMALKLARSEDVAADRERLRSTLTFLLHQQWSEAACFACAPGVVGAFSESMASPRIRIDYVQHAWAALGHGGRLL